jgi:hypothetical protein
MATLNGRNCRLFPAGNEIKRGSRVGNLATEITGTWTAWPITKKNL